MAYHPQEAASPMGHQYLQQPSNNPYLSQVLARGPYPRQPYFSPRYSSQGLEANEYSDWAQQPRSYNATHSERQSFAEPPGYASAPSSYHLQPAYLTDPQGFSADPLSSVQFLAHIDHARQYQSQSYRAYPTSPYPVLHNNPMAPSQSFGSRHPSYAADSFDEGYHRVEQSVECHSECQSDRPIRPAPKKPIPQKRARRPSSLQAQHHEAQHHESQAASEHLTLDKHEQESEETAAVADDAPPLALLAATALGSERRKRAREGSVRHTTKSTSKTMNTLSYLNDPMLMPRGDSEAIEDQVAPRYTQQFMPVPRPSHSMAKNRRPSDRSVHTDSVFVPVEEEECQAEVTAERPSKKSNTGCHEGWTDYQCSYCGKIKTSTSAGADGRVRIRCECGGKHRDNTPRMHAMWQVWQEPLHKPTGVSTFIELNKPASRKLHELQPEMSRTTHVNPASHAVAREWWHQASGPFHSNTSYQ